jgi:hypothetical protein
MGSERLDLEGSFTVHITEVATGETRTHRENGEFQEFLWTEGNYACDCNRALFFARAVGNGDPNVACSTGRFVVRVVDDQTGQCLYG